MKSRDSKATDRKEDPVPDDERAQPDDFFELPFGYMARYGRFLTTRSTLSPEQHARAIDAMLAGEDAERQEQQKRRERLLEILARVDSIDLLARASLTYLHFDPDTYKEWQSDRSPAHIEYLALQILGLGCPAQNAANAIEATKLTFEALDVVRELFRSASFLIILDGIKARRKNGDDPAIEYMVKTRMESLSVRGTGYGEHLARVLHGCLDAFGGECRHLLGFTASEALALTHGIADLVSDRLEPGWHTAADGYAETIRAWKKARKHREQPDPRFPKWALDLAPSAARQYIGLLVSSWLYRDSRSLSMFSPEDLAAHCSIDARACGAFLKAFACPATDFRLEHHAFPGGAHPMTLRPIIEVAGRYILPVPTTMIEAIRPRMEDLLQTDKGIWDRYMEHRGRYLEHEAIALLSGALPGSTSWNRIGWRSVGESGDLDGLVAADDLTTRIQCKAGRLTAPTRRGAPERMKRDIGELVERAARQHLALDQALKTHDSVAIGFTEEQANALRAVLQVEVIVCLDDVGVWSTEAHELREIGVLPADRPVPWVLSLTDLMVVTDVLAGAEFVHYLLRRQRLERDGRMMAHDELDWLGHYAKEGLFFDHYFEGDSPADGFRLLSYTEPLDSWYLTREGLRTVEAPKPTRPLPQFLAKLIRRLEEERPPHWILAGVSLLDGDQKSRDMWNGAVKHARKRVKKVGWSNASQIFDGRLGVTLYVDKRTAWPEIGGQVEDYCRKKAFEGNLPNWIGIGEGATDSLVVVLVERDAQLSLADVFLEPPAPATPGTKAPAR